jgi:hypothetical protein
MFLDFLKIPGSSLTEQSNNFIARADADARWIERSFMDFMSYQLQRVENHEITESTIRNYYKATKLFCEMNDLLSVNWKKITRGIPRGR